MDAIILGDGGLGQAIAAALARRGEPTRILGRPRAGRHDPQALRGASVVFEASRGDAVRTNVETAIEAGCRRLVVATTGWDTDRPAVEALLRSAGVAAIIAPNLSLGAAVFLRLVAQAAALLGTLDGFEPYVVEHHRRTKVDRPSGTAREIVRRIAAASPGAFEPGDLEVAVVRAGSSPGMHLVGFDAAGETLELRLTARDRAAYAAGALASADWLLSAPRQPGFHALDEMIDDLITAPAALAASA
jgi:4-hydroxy-tetrahydrodipicolinate reductase